MSLEFQYCKAFYLLYALHCVVTSQVTRWATVELWQEATTIPESLAWSCRKTWGRLRRSWASWRPSSMRTCAGTLNISFLLKTILEYFSARHWEVRTHNLNNFQCEIWIRLLKSACIAICVQEKSFTERSLHQRDFFPLLLRYVDVWDALSYIWIPNSYYVSIHPMGCTGRITWH